MSETKIKTIDIPDGLLSAENIKYTEDQTVKDVLDLAEIQTTTEQTLPQSKPGGLKLVHMDGNSEQKTYSGKNLCPLGTKEVNAYETFTLEKPILAGTYTMSATVTSTDTDVTYNLIAFIDSNNEKMNVALPSRGERVSKVFTLDRDAYMIRLNSSNNTTNSSGDTSVWTDIQIEEGTVATPYEPYVGGIASPNPDYPQSIKNTGDCVEMMQGTYNNTTGAHTSNAERICNKHKIPCKNGDVVNVKFEKAVNIYSRYYNEDTFITNYDGADNVTEYSFTIPSDATHFNFVVALYGGGNITPQTVGKITLTINDKYVVPVKMVGKNWLSDKASDYQNMTEVTYDGRKCLSWRDTSNHFKYLRDFKPNTPYTFTATTCNPDSLGTGTHYCIFFNYTDGTSKIHNIHNKGWYTFTITSDATKTLKGISGSHYDGKTLYLDVEKSQIEEGTEATPYEPYTEHTEYILLDEPLRKVRDVADQIVEVDDVWNENHKRKTVVFDGSELRASSYTYANIVYYYINKPTDMLGYGKQIDANLLSNKFTNGASYPWDNSDNVGKVTTGAIGSQIWFGFPIGTTLEQAQSIGSIEIEYELATQTFTPLDTESQKVLNRLKTFNSVTYVEVDSVVQPSGMEFEYGTSKVGAYTLEALLNSKRALIVDTVETETAAVSEEETTE